MTVTSQRRLDPVLAALRGSLSAKPYDARAIVRPSANPACGLLPVAAAMSVSIDSVATAAHEVGLGPELRRTMSQFARQQGDTFDANINTDGAPLVAAFQAEGWIATPSINVVNVDDHVDPPRASGLTGDGGKPTEQQWRSYHRTRARYTVNAHSRALSSGGPTLLLRGVVETTSLAGTALPAFGEFDAALILPPGIVPSDALCHELGIAPDHTGLTLIGDAKSWRRLGRLDNGDKRAAVALQVSLYVAAARIEWPAAQAATVLSVGVAVNPPGTGGLATAALTRLDLSDSLRTVAATRGRATQVVADAAASLAADVAAGARLDPADPDATRRALRALMGLSAWTPSCLSACPMGQTCRRHASDGGEIARLGDVAVYAGPVERVGRLQELRAGMSPTPEEQEVAARLRGARTLLGADPAVPWPDAPPEDAGAHAAAGGAEIA
jgi:hypothetical protein